MKKLLFLALIVYAASTSYSQNANNHMTFKGIPINGSLSDFTAQMKQKGFTHLATQDGIAAFTGEFAAYKECTVAAVSSKSTNTVSKVGVIFPECDTWSRLYGNYSHLKEMLTQKYGEPIDCVEMFDTDDEPRDDNSRMHEVRMNRCKYATTWRTEKGDIELAIIHADYTSCVRLSYLDKINTEKVTNSAMDDL